MTARLRAATRFLARQAAGRGGSPTDRRWEAAVNRLFATASSWIANAAGRPATFALAFAVVLLWSVAGPILGFSDTWQLIMNTVSSVVTFLMVFLIQNAQNRDSEAMHAKLDTLLAALVAADNRYIGIERLTDREIEAIRARFGPAPCPEPEA